MDFINCILDINLGFGYNNFILEVEMA